MNHAQIFKRGFVRGAVHLAGGSSGMHGSETDLGGTMDTRRVCALCVVQVRTVGWVACHPRAAAGDRLLPTSYFLLLASYILERLQVAGGC